MGIFSYYSTSLSVLQDGLSKKRKKASGNAAGLNVRFGKMSG